MTSDAERWKRVEQLFHQALERSPDERRYFLALACAGDDRLRSEVERLLDAETHAQTRLQDIVVASAARTVRAFDVMPGTMVGGYRLDRELGRGGMGSVWLGHRADDPVARAVAIKLVRPEFASPGVLRRFRHEHRILADLRHPNIAELLDAGSTKDGRPYFVMEYIAGAAIDIWCRERQLGVDARIDLFIAVCAAVHHAHDQHIIHRDLKPGNILVTRDGTPKLLDFGIAKLLGPAASHTLLTAPGVRLMTPSYASPEQMRGIDVSPASDVYSLGVALYELLAGRLPYTVEGDMPQAMAAAIVRQQPEPPSMVVADKHLRDRLAGDLDALLLAALRKEPGRRFPSVKEFARQLWLHRRGEPVALPS